MGAVIKYFDVPIAFYIGSVVTVKMFLAMVFVTAISYISMMFKTSKGRENTLWIKYLGGIGAFSLILTLISFKLVGGERLGIWDLFILTLALVFSSYYSYNFWKEYKKVKVDLQE